MKNVLKKFMCGALSVAMFAGASAGVSTPVQAKSSSKGEVYYLNFKPEADKQWKELAKLYTKKTGVKVTVLTAASGQYESTLKSEMAKKKMPTLFQVNGPVGLASW